MVQYQDQKKRYLIISGARFILVILFLISIYYRFGNQGSDYWLLIAAGSAITFFLLLSKHMKLAQKTRLTKVLADINQNEKDYVENISIPFDNGVRHSQSKHAYTHDLDVFGENSLFHRLNRTATHIGSYKLAHHLSNRLSNDAILKQQEAINEVSNNIDWRQKFLAIAITGEDNKKTYDTLIDWANTNAKPQTIIVTILSYVFTIAAILALVTYAWMGTEITRIIFSVLFLINVGILGQQYKFIKKEILGESKINKPIQKYSLLMALFEEQSFQSEKLQQLQKRLLSEQKTASLHIHNLSKLFQQMDSIHNPMGAIIFNGICLYHVHTLRKLKTWKAANASKIQDWLEVIGEIESINSMANFAFNNPDYTYPKINSQEKITFNDLGHPMLTDQVRICNDVRFENQKFIILTGSNMSGKSTFLRSLGINMVLANAGSPICATDANVHPLDIYVSMRLSDSLTDNESYFFAEVKRLKEVMDAAENNLTFILLDEILRGTNSDDKREGTIEVIKKLISKNVIGAIATHDLKVCETTSEFPSKLSNKNFEVEIVDEELVFDYKLRDGICKNKSATYIMKKMEII